MANSLQDQLLKAGLIDPKTLKKTSRDKRKADKVARRSGQEVVDESKALAQRAIADKAERNRALNQQRDEQALRKAIAAQIKQLIETSRIARRGGDIAYNFTDGKKIKKLYVDATQQRQLSAGQIAIAKLGDHYELVPKAVAEKIRQRDELSILVLNQPSATALAEDDPYAGYEIPDDLMW